MRDTLKAHFKFGAKVKNPPTLLYLAGIFIVTHWIHYMQTNFLLGALKITEPARIALRRQPYDLIARHAINEHGLISAKERTENERSMRTLGPIVSRYMVDPTNPRSKTIVVETKECWDETLIYLD